MGDTTVDLAAVLEQVTLQRNTALDEVARWRAKCGELAAENERLAAELEARDRQ